MAKLSADRKPRALQEETPSKIEKILKSIARGIPNKIAIEAAGMCEAQFYNLVTQGMCDISANKKSVQADMVERLRNIEQESIGLSLDKIKDAEKGHRGAEWFLERRYWKFFGMNVSVVELADDMEKLKREMAAKKTEE